MKLFYLMAIFMLAGCASSPKKDDVKPADQSRQVAQEVKPEAVKVSVRKAPAYPTGSLFNANYGHFMFSDRRAYRLGDILTIELEGTTNITMSGLSKVTKNNAINIPDPTLLGRTGASILGSGNSLAFNLQPTRTYGGDTSASRGNSLKGNIAVKVIEVFPNGTLRIEGGKWLTINSGKELIKISGLVRPEDIKTDNKVSSERLAEARIDYVALGNNSDAHEPGWMTKVLNSKWFPF